MSFPKNPYNTSIPGGPGIDERQIHIASGLRTRTLSGICLADRTAVVNAFIPANQTAFTAMTLATNGQRMIFPCTPVITLTHVTTASASTFQIRIKGYDQFGSATTELLPSVTSAPTDAGDVCLQVASKVFAYITEVAFTLSGFETGDIFGVGWDFIWDGVLFAAEDGGDSQIFGAANMGIGTPLRISPYGPNLGAVQDPNATDVSIDDPEMVSLVMVNHTNSDAVIVVPARADLSTEDEGFEVGVSVAGYQGTPHKVGIELDATDAGLGTFLTVPVSGAGTDDLIHNDTISFHMTMRSSIGTGRRSGSRSSYVR